MQPEREVRCPSGALHLKIIDDEIEVKCNHWRCTDGGDVVALHRFTADGVFLQTLTFKDPRGQRARRFRKETR